MRFCSLIFRAEAHLKVLSNAPVPEHSTTLAVAGSLRRRACPPADKYSGRGPLETSSAKRDAGYSGRVRSAASRRLAERSPAGADCQPRQYDEIGRVAAVKLCLAEHMRVEVGVEGGAAGRGVEQISGAGDESAEAL